MTRRRFLVGARFQKTEAPILKVRSPMVPIRSVVLGSREQVMAKPAGACRCRRYDNVLSRHPSRRSSHRPRFDLRIRRPPMSAMGQADKPSPAKAGLCPLLLRKRTKVGAAVLSALCHVWTAPSWQELSSRLQHWSVQPCVRPHMMVSPSSADLGRPRSKVGLSSLQAFPANLTSGGS
jgi:hypothetical protein